MEEKVEEMDARVGEDEGAEVGAEICPEHNKIQKEPKYDA